MRIFTAIPLPEEKKEQTGQLMQGKLPVSYVNITNLHITLNFFGELTADETTKAQNAFAKIVAQRPKFNIEFDQIKKLGSQIHMTLKPNVQLVQLQSELEQEFIKLGFKFPNRAYYAHVKLATMHYDKVMTLSRKVEYFPNEQLQQLNFVASEAIMFESQLLREGVKHEPLETIKFV